MSKSLIKPILIAFLSIWSVISAIIFILVMLSQSYSGLLRYALLAGFVINLIIIFVGVFCLILDMLFNSELEKFSSTFGLLIILLFASSSLVNFIPQLKNSLIDVMFTNVLWFMSLFLLVYIVTRKTRVIDEEIIENKPKAKPRRIKKS